VANAPAGQVAIHCKAAGPNVTLSSREAGCLLGLGRGADDVLRGRTRMSLVGTVEEITPLLHAVLDRFRALSRATREDEERARPLDRRRNGFIAAAGSTMLVLERGPDAAARGAGVLSRVRAWGSAFDATAGPAGWGSGASGLAAALLRLLRRAGLEPAEVDLIVSGASGSVAGDRLEARTLREVWNGSPLPPVVTPKAAVGEYGGGFLAAAVLAASGESIGPVRPSADADPELGIVPSSAGECPPRPRRVLVTSLAAGGSAAWAILEPP
jgi:3-oxoacyl-[acyl-carrier-protein] synthase II